jgi:hypothetical protein
VLFVSFRQIGLLKAVVFLCVSMQLHLRLYHEILWYFESKERPGLCTSSLYSPFAVFFSLLSSLFWVRTLLSAVSNQRKAAKVSNSFLSSIWFLSYTVASLPYPQPHPSLLLPVFEFLHITKTVNEIQQADGLYTEHHLFKRASHRPDINPSHPSWNDVAGTGLGSLCCWLWVS